MMPDQTAERTLTGTTHALACPNCAGSPSISEGVRVLRCPYCGQHSLLLGERGVRRWQTPCKIDRDGALQAVKRFFSGRRKASDLASRAEISDLWLVYAPYWRVGAHVVGWVFGRRGQAKGTLLLEEEVIREMEWNDAAVDMSELGIHHITIPDAELEPYTPELLRRKAMLFEPAESATEAMAQAERHFVDQAQKVRRFDTVDSVDIRLLRPRISLIYHPLWLARYRYRRRVYQVTVDGWSGDLLAGTAPGSIAYRAKTLVLGMAAGTFLAANGAALLVRWAAHYLENFYDADLSGFPGCLSPLVILMAYYGVKLALDSYRRFRYGDEIEEIAPSAKKG
jgi:hypothetical protein